MAGDALPAGAGFGGELPRVLIEHTLDVLSVLAPDGTILFESPTVHRWTGWEPHELVGRNGFELVHPDDRELVRQAIATALATPVGQATVTYRLRHKQGGWRWIESLGTNRVHDPRVGGVVVSSRDVTERRALDEQLRHAQKMDAVGRLAGGVAHDFNNLLTAILGYASLLEDRLPLADAGARSAAGEIRRSAERAAALTRQLLAFSRRSAELPRLWRIDAVVEEIERMLRRLIGEDIRVHTVLGALRSRVLIDRGQLEQVLVNLVVNARDAMSGGGNLRLATADLELAEGDPRLGLLKPGPYVSLAVSDSGQGMDEEVLSHLFEPFFTTKEPGRGTGLGLSVVWGIVRDAGGSILVESVPGHGSTFTVLLPAAELGPEPTPERTRVLVPRATGETVLLVEDDPAVRGLLAAALRAGGYLVLAAEDGERALALSTGYGGEIALLLSDVVMPRMSGPELAVAMRRDRPGLRVLFVTGYSDVDLEGEEVLPKPFTPSLVLAKVRTMLAADDD